MFRPARLFLGIVTLVAACVPATEERAPRGAAGVVVEPSAATRGEPIVTSDGWTVRFEKFAYMAAQRAGNSPSSTAVQRADSKDDPPAGNSPSGKESSLSVMGSTEPQVWGASRGEMYIPALAPGVVGVDLQLNGVYLYPGSSPYFDESEEASTVGPSGISQEVNVKPSDVKRGPDVEPATVQRFLELPDNHRPDPNANEYSFYFGPAVVFALRAEKTGRIYSMELALDTRTTFDDATISGGLVEVRANAVAFANWEAHAERLLDESSTGDLRFSDIAAADDNGDRDGRVTAAELRAVKMDEASCDEDDLEEGSFDSETDEPPCPTLVDRLATRARRILVPKP